MADPEAQKFASGLALLLKEYAAKLEQRLEEARRARSQARERKAQWVGSSEFHAITFGNSVLTSALLTATREASQLAEQGAVDDLTRIELTLRRAEVEGLINSLNNIAAGND
jgi:DNA-binding transcriptional regulator YbjK